MNKNELKKYFITIAKTIFVAIIIVVAITWNMQDEVYKIEEKAKTQDESIDYYLVGMLLDKNKYLEAQNPDDFRINVKLGILYEIKKNYTQAEEEYKKADSKAPYGEFKPKFKLISLYIFRNRLDEAENILENLDERPDKKIVETKAELYTKLGDKYYSRADYENAIPRYRKALFYFGTINSKITEELKNNIASAYVYQAEHDVDNLNIEDAISSLKMALGIVDAPIIKYKLALLLMKDEPLESAKYFQQVFNEEPSIINYDTYYKFLSALALESELKGNIALAKLYDFKIEKLKQYQNENILSINDLAIENIYEKIKFNNWKGKYDIKLNFDLKNVSNHNINSLITNIIFTDKDAVIDEYNKQVVDKKFPLRPGFVSPTISINTSKPISPTDTYPKEIKVQIFVAKTDKAYKILLKEITLKEESKHNPALKNNPIIKFFQKFYH